MQTPPVIAGGVFIFFNYRESNGKNFHADFTLFMMMVNSITYLFLAFVTSVFSPKPKEKAEELVDWKSNRPLTWSDYKGTPNPESDAAATTTTLVGIEYHIKNNSFSYSIQCRFSKNQSWGLHKTAYILAHEQGHFDIAEIYARKLNQEMQEYIFNRRTYEKDLRKIYNKVMQEKEDFQNRYDKETRHSINREKQFAWLDQIDELLEETADYADYK